MHHTTYYIDFRWSLCWLWLWLSALTLTCTFTLRVEIVPVSATSAVVKLITLVGALVVVVTCYILLASPSNRWQSTSILCISTSFLTLFNCTKVVLVATTSTICKYIANTILTVVIVFVLHGSAWTSF